jgi:hypothetical protein
MRKDLNDSDSNYLVTACLVKQGKNYFDAESYCLSNGMDLINIRGYEQRNALYAYAISIFGYGTPTTEASVYVKGYSSYNCRRILNGGGLFGETFKGCSSNMWFFCAYKK